LRDIGHFLFFFSFVTGEVANKWLVQLLDKLHIKPVCRQLHVMACWEAGHVIQGDLLEISDSAVLQKVQNYMQQMAVLCYTLSCHCLLTVPLLLRQCFITTMATAVESDYPFSSSKANHLAMLVHTQFHLQQQQAHMHIENIGLGRLFEEES
jgi:hypothetical protein